MSDGRDDELVNGLFDIMTFEERADALEAAWTGIDYYIRREIVGKFLAKRAQQPDPSRQL